MNASATVRDSTVEGGFDGPGNLRRDPRFWLPETGDFHLRRASPCIGAGLLAGLPVDQGALKFDDSYCPAPRLFCPQGLVGSCAPEVVRTPSEVIVTGLPAGSLVLLRWSVQTQAMPVNEGLLCLAPPIGAFPPGSATSGTACGEARFPAPLATWLAFGLARDETVRVQPTYRDPVLGTRLGPALEFALCD